MHVLTGVDSEPFTEFVEVRYAELLRTAYLLTGSPHAAEDLVQSCLLKIMPKFATLDDPLAYTRRAMANDRTSTWRRFGRELLTSRPPDPPYADPSGGTVERTMLLAALGKLPRRMRAVLVLRYWEDLSEAETAEILGCAPGTVKSQASRGLARLRDVLHEREEAR